MTTTAKTHRISGDHKRYTRIGMAAIAIVFVAFGGFAAKAQTTTIP